MDDKFRMKREFELKEGLYFVHGYYLSGWRENDIEELYRDQMILMQDSMDDIYDIDAYDINLREMRMENQIMIPEGEFVYYDGREFQTAEDNPVRRHIVGGANRTLISAETPLRSCRIGTCRRLSAG